MSRKAFHICVDFDVHAVTCPGVWLCPKGRIELRIAMLGLSVNTKAIAPSFPLLFHEKFRFHKMLRSVNSLGALQDVLKSRNLNMQLLHTSAVAANTVAHSCGGSTTVLATFRSPIADVFYPSTVSHNLNAGTDVDLLLKPTACFPGIISPKAEISTRVVIEEVVNYCSPERVINPVTISSKADNNVEDLNPFVRQRAVCHSDACQCCDCYKAKNTTSSEQAPFLVGKLPRRPSFRPKQHKRLTKTKNKSLAADKKEYDEESSHFNCHCEPQDEEECSTVCKCVLCRKYKDYFPSVDYTSSDVEMKPKSKPKENECRYCCGDQKEKRRQRKSSSPVKQLESCCPCMSVNRIPMMGEVGEVDENGFRPSLKDTKQDCANCISSRPERQRRSVTVLKSAVVAPPFGGAEEGVRSPPGIRGCSCGIYSCSEWRRQPTIKQRQVSSRTADRDEENFRDSRKNFYSSLEEYYRRLYARARQRSSMECVNACA